MIINYIHRIGWFVGLILLQVLILNNVHIAGVATPFLYVYFILKFNSGTSRNELMVWGFCMGLAIDIFSNTRYECGGDSTTGFSTSVVSSLVYASRYFG